MGEMTQNYLTRREREEREQQGAHTEERAAEAAKEHKRARRGERVRAAWEDDYKPAGESEEEELWGMCMFADAAEWKETL